VPIKWPRSRDEVWKANIPHTHLASEKSDQNWMVVKGEKIVFPGGGTHFHYGAQKYIAAMANVKAANPCTKYLKPKTNAVGHFYPLQACTNI